MEDNHYTVLGIGRGASPDQIKEAYRRLVRVHHPDANPADRDVAEQKIKAVFSAYATLSNPARRERFDLSLPKQDAADQAQEAANSSGTGHTVFVHPSAPVSLLGRVREANGFTLDDMAHRLGLSPESLAQMESRDAVPQAPVQLRTVIHLTEQAIKELANRGKATEAEALRTALNRRKNQRSAYR